MKARARFEVVSEDAEKLVIMDVGPWTAHPTVTNDAEAVVEELAPTLKGRRLLYYDSDGDLDELMVKDGKFEGFFPGPGR